MRGLAMLCTLLWFMTMPLAAQNLPGTPTPLPGRIEGRLLDTDTERPIDGATVRIQDLDIPVKVTGTSGQFRFTDVPRGIHAIEISHIAYGTGTHLVNVPEGETVYFVGRVRASAIELEPLVIEVDARVSRLEEVGFLRRQRSGWGRYFAGEDADAWRISQIIYSVPGLTLYQGRSTVDRRVVFRRGRFTCTPEIYLDGVFQRWAGGDVQSVVLGLEIEGIEIYRGITTPPEFVSTGDRPCGAIVIWTRRQ